MATMVPGGGFEPPREAPHAPQACASAKFRHPGMTRSGGPRLRRSGESAPHYRNRARRVSNGGRAFSRRMEGRVLSGYFASHTTYRNCTSIVTQPRLVTRNIVFVVPVAWPLGRITDG
jgi:hypothetical protein